MNSLFLWKPGASRIIELGALGGVSPMAKQHDLAYAAGAAFSPDGATFCRLDDYGKTLWAYDVGDPFTLSNPRSVQTPYAIGEYGGTVAPSVLAVSDTLIALGNVTHNTGEVPLRLLDRQTLETVADLPATGKSAEVLAFSPDGSRLAVGHSGPGNDSRLRLYRLDEENYPFKAAPPPLVWYNESRLLAFSEDGSLLLEAHNANINECNERPPVTVYFTSNMLPKHSFMGYRGEGLNACARVGNRLFIGRGYNPWAHPAGHPPLSVYDFVTGVLGYGPICKTPDGQLLNLGVSGVAWDAWQNRLYLTHNEVPSDRAPKGAYSLSFLDLNNMDVGYHPVHVTTGALFYASYGNRHRTWMLQQQRGKLHGQVRDANNQPAKRTVQALSREPVLCVGQAQSDAATGQYQMLLENQQPVDLVFRAEEDENLNDLFYARVTPADAGQPPLHPPMPEWVAYDDSYVGSKNDDGAGQVPQIPPSWWDENVRGTWPPPARSWWDEQTYGTWLARPAWWDSGHFGEWPPNYWFYPEGFKNATEPWSGRDEALHGTWPPAWIGAVGLYYDAADEVVWPPAVLAGWDEAIHGNWPPVPWLGDTGDNEGGDNLPPPMPD